MDQTGYPAESSAPTPASSPLARAQAWAAIAARQGMLNHIPAQRERAAA